MVIPQNLIVLKFVSSFVTNIGSKRLLIANASMVSTNVDLDDKIGNAQRFMII